MTKKELPGDDFFQEETEEEADERLRIMLGFQTVAEMKIELAREKEGDAAKKAKINSRRIAQAEDYEAFAAKEFTEENLMLAKAELEKYRGHSENDRSMNPNKYQSQIRSWTQRIKQIEKYLQEKDVKK